jgi:hypothetical protein
MTPSRSSSSAALARRGGGCVQDGTQSPRVVVDANQRRDRMRGSLLILAHRVSWSDAAVCLELGVKPTYRLSARTSQFDPIETSVAFQRTLYEGLQPADSGTDQI